MKLVAGLLLALLSSGCFAASYVGQHRAIAHLERLRLGRPLRSLHRLLTNRGWLLAYASSWIGWCLYIVALSLAPLSIVQAISAGGIGVLVLAARRSALLVTRRERSAVVLALAGLVLVLGSVRTVSHPGRPPVGLVLGIVGVALALATVLIAVVPARSRGAALGAISGLCYGAGDIATKAAVLGEAVLVPVFLACAALGFITLQLAYQRTSLLASAGLSSLLTNSIPIVAGVFFFGESPPHGPATWLRAVGFAAVIMGAVGLSSDQQPT